MSKHRIRHPAIAVLATRLFCRPAVTPGVTRAGADGIGYIYSIDPLFKEFVDFLSSDFEETSMSEGQSNHIVIRNKHLMFYLPTPLRGFTTSLQGFFSGPEYVLSANKIMRAHDYLGSGSVGCGALGDNEKGKDRRMWRYAAETRKGVTGPGELRRQYRDEGAIFGDLTQSTKNSVWGEHPIENEFYTIEEPPIPGWAAIGATAIAAIVTDFDNKDVHRDDGRGTIDLSDKPKRPVLARPRQSFMSGYNEGNYKRVKSASQEWIEAQGWHELMPMIYADRAFIIEWFELCAQLGVQTKSMSSAEMDWLRDIIGGGQWEKAVTVSIDTSGWPV